MSNSSLVTYKAMTSHYGYGGIKKRGSYKIDKIFVHHMAGNLTVQQCGRVFKTREASAHYGINGTQIGQYVDESEAAWHCGNKAYNLRSIGIECANSGGAASNWKVSDTTIKTLIKLLVDICRRNGIKKLNFTGNLNGNLCLHCYTQPTACPGGYLKSKMKWIAAQANAELAKKDPAPAPAPAPAKKTLYRVRKNWNDPKTQIGAFESLTNAKLLADKNPGYSVYNETGKRVYPEVIEQIYRVRKTWSDEQSQKGAFKSLANAKQKCDEYPGYSVYDYSGKAVYTSKKKDSVTDKILAACQTQSKWMKNYTYNWDKWNPRNIERSAKYGTCVTFVACVLQRIGVLKSGEYVWHNGSGYGTGKVTGTVTSRMHVTYMGNKSLASLIKQLQAGDIILVDDNRSGHKGSGGHIFILTGAYTSSGNPMIWDNNTAKHGCKAISYNKNRKVLARIRIK